LGDYDFFIPSILQATTGACLRLPSSFRFVGQKNTQTKSRRHFRRLLATGLPKRNGIENYKFCSALLKRSTFYRIFFCLSRAKLAATHPLDTVARDDRPSLYFVPCDIGSLS
jgi:hypothetical protein